MMINVKDLYKVLYDILIDADDDQRQIVRLALHILDIAIQRLKDDEYRK